MAARGVLKLTQLLIEAYGDLSNTNNQVALRVIGQHHLYSRITILLLTLQSLTPSHSVYTPSASCELTWVLPLASWDYY